MSGAFGLAGWHFSSNPTSSSSENKIGKAEGTEPWKTGGNAAYQYHPHGDPSKPRKDAPSALNEVIIPNVNLPKVSLSEIWRDGDGLGGDFQWVAEGWRSLIRKNEMLTYDCSRFTRSTTSGARRASKRLVTAEGECCVNIKSFEWSNRAISLGPHRLANFPDPVSQIRSLKRPCVLYRSRCNNRTSLCYRVGQAAPRTDNVHR